MPNEVTMKALERYKRHAGKVYDKVMAKVPRREDVVSYWRYVYNECERQITQLAKNGIKRISKPYILRPEGKIPVNDDGELCP